MRLSTNAPLPPEKTDWATQIDLGNLPRHVAIIMDGNGRWARSRGMPRLFGHQRGVEALKEGRGFAHDALLVVGEARGNNSDLQFSFLQLLIADCTEDDLGIGVYGLGDNLGSVLNLKHSKIVASGDGEEHTLGAVDGDLKER